MMSSTPQPPAPGIDSATSKHKEELPAAEISGESVAVLQSSSDHKAWPYTVKESPGELPKPLEACDRSYIPLPAEK